MKLSTAGCLVLAATAIGGCAKHGAANSAADAACVDDERTWGRPSQVAVIEGPMTSDVTGVVLLVDAAAPLAGAKVWIDSTTGPPAMTAADGRFAFPNVSRGRHAIVMRRIGMRALRDSIDVPVAGQLRIDARPLPNDAGCDGLGEVVVAKPWWRFW